jgi:hypothetical protein
METIVQKDEKRISFQIPAKTTVSGRSQYDISKWQDIPT